MNVWMFLIIYFSLNLVATYIFGRMGEFRYNPRSRADKAMAYEAILVSLVIGVFILPILGFITAAARIVDLVTYHTEGMDPLRPLRNLFNIGPRD